MAGLTDFSGQVEHGEIGAPWVPRVEQSGHEALDLRAPAGFRVRGVTEIATGKANGIGVNDRGREPESEAEHGIRDIRPDAGKC
jgi:hypothetical protein